MPADQQGRGGPMAAGTAAVGVLLVILGACGTSRPHAAAPPTPPPTTRSTVGGSTAPTTAEGPATTTAGSKPGCAEQIFATLTETERVGQLFMIGQSLAAPDPVASRAVRDQLVGGVVLYGNSRAPLAAIRAVTDRFRADARASAPAVGLYVATDQEGGQIQELAGPGFDPIPTGVAQGVTDPRRLEAEARTWGIELTQAGVNVDLSPVVDVVPSASAAVNQPIARYQRQLGDNPATVAVHGTAVVRGLQGAGVSATLKHFPGLGRVVGNTDTTAGVDDSATTRHDPFLSPFAAGIQGGARLVMVSLATYRQIDQAHRAVFSSIVMKDVLRGDMGFRGLVISDDLGSSQQVIDAAPGARAIDFLTAGGTIVLTVKPASVIGPMVAAVQAQAKASLPFRELVDADALAVLTAKQQAGLLVCP